MMYSAYSSQPSRSYGSYSAQPESGLERTIEIAYRTAAILLSHQPQQPYLAAAINANPYATIYSGRINRSGSSNKGTNRDSPDCAFGLSPNCTAAPLSTLCTNSAIYHAQPLAFLSPTRPRTPFTAAAAEISEFIKEAFAKTTQKELAEDITITVAIREMLQQIHRQFTNAGIVGLSLNSNHGKEIFAVAGNLDEVMLIIGHELGHVLTPALPDAKAEEAKAFAFETAWAQAIFLHDIAGLRNSINSAALNMRPAQNGLHDLAFAFVKAATMAGKEPLTLHSQLSEQQNFDTSFENEFISTAAAANPSNITSSYVPLISSTPSRISYHNSGYRNKSNVQNVPWLQNFTWTDLGTGIYGMYIPLTASIFMNDRLLRTDMEQFHKTLGHEYILHHVMQLPDGYVAKILEETIFWTKDENDKYKP